MQRDNELRSDLIDLGTVSAETKGIEGNVPDLAQGQNLTGLTDD